MSASTKSLGGDRPKLFIVYQMSELALADALFELFNSWGYRAFHCRTKGRDAEQFRRDLRQRLFSSDLVVFILSQEFQWSAYCQAETGTAMALEIPFVVITVPPVTPRSVRDIAPVLERMDVMSVNEPEFIGHLQSELQARLAESVRRKRALLDRLQKSGSFSLKPRGEIGSSKLATLNAVSRGL